MKSVTNKELIGAIVLNIGMLIFLVSVWLTYNHRQTIINSEEPIQNYSVLEFDCHRKTSSHILIEFKGKQYRVGVPGNKCRQFDPQKIKFFYDKEKDDVFEASELGVRHIVLGGILYLFFSILLFAVIRERVSSSS